MSRQVNLLDLDEWLSELVLTKRSAAVFEVSDDKADQRLVRSKAYGKSRVNTADMWHGIVRNENLRHRWVHTWAQVTPVSAQSSHVGQPEKAAKVTHVGATSRVPSSTVLLSVVPVCVHGSTSSSLTYALLDPGSEATLITEEMDNKLGLTRKKSTVRLATFYVSVPITTSAMVSFQVSGTDGMYTTHVKNVITVPGLNLSQRTMD
ncbi:hypothetical protein M513_09321 [Trichuris suis]|uniref:Peptidase A2 domain-containing protein n=1 Tax=Trichuris suis TaxID=68888 RepID=A0A085LY08_9BILA|nr:hypothetical protein M513_09321 [Trichuris suis]